MRTKIITMLLSGVLLAGCDTLGQSALLGAGAGAAVAVAVGGDPVTGAVIGGAGGAVCHETDIC